MLSDSHEPNGAWHLLKLPLTFKNMNKELLEKKIKDLENEIKGLKAGLEDKNDLLPSKDNLGWYIDSLGWYIDSGGEICTEVCLAGAEMSFDINNWFATEEEAEKELEKRKALARIKRYTIKNNMHFTPDWDNHEETKYSFFYDYLLREHSPIGYFKSLREKLN
jgi:hypothetical protein